MSTEDKVREMMAAARAEESVTHTEWTNFAGRAHRSLYMRRTALAVGALAIIGLGVAGATTLLAEEQMTKPLPPVETPSESVEPTPTPITEAPPTVEVPESQQELWYVLNERLTQLTFEVGGEIDARLAPADDELAQRAAFWLELMVDGGIGLGHEVPHTTAIPFPRSPELLGVERAEDGLVIDLSSEFESGGGSLSMQLRVAQVVYTATQFPGIDRVFFMIEGRRVDAIGGEGVIVSDGLTRRDFQDGYLAPNIVVETPRPGDEISSGDTLAGFANVFEANVNYRVVAENGDVISEDFTTATCGSGCWGDFSVDLEFAIDEVQQGVIEVLTFSAEDGSEQDLIRIPVTLQP